MIKNIIKLFFSKKKKNPVETLFLTRKSKLIKFMQVLVSGVAILTSHYRELRRINYLYFRVIASKRNPKGNGNLFCIIC